MGSTPCPQVRRYRYSGECPSPNQEDAGYLGSQPQAPNISDGVYLGVAQAPGCIWGVPHAPKSDAAAIRENARTPIRKTQAVWESPSPISPMACIWELPKPQGVYGERPMPPRQDATAIRGAALGFAASLCEEPNERRKLFGEPTPSPQYLRWRVFGSCPSPEVYMGSTPYLQCQTLQLFGRMPEP